MKKAMQKEKIIDVIMYLFEQHMKESCEIPVKRKLLIAELKKAGFNKNEIHKAFSWLYGLVNYATNTNTTKPSKNTFRVFTAFESSKINKKCRGLLLHLEKTNILPTELRELVINQLLSLEGREINLGQVKWVVLMALFSQRKYREQLQRMERLVLDDFKGKMH